MIIVAFDHSEYEWPDAHFSTETAAGVDPTAADELADLLDLISAEVRDGQIEGSFKNETGTHTYGWWTIGQHDESPS